MDRRPLFLGLVFLSLLANAGAVGVSVVPQPLNVVLGKTTLEVSHLFNFTAADSHSNTLKMAFERYLGLIFSHSNSRDPDVQKMLSVMTVTIDSEDESLQLETDESYRLEISAFPPSAHLQGATVYGALRGLETFSQLVTYNFLSGKYQIQNASLSIHDKPRFPHRGLMIDTSRHFEPIMTIRKIIDSMSYAKLNVLHWHVVDSQSFPMQSLSYPKLWNGAYTRQERYTVDDARGIVEYARQRGIRVLAEFDMPGHAASWCVGYPEICPAPDCTQPLNPAANETFNLIEGLLKELSGVFVDDFIHLGGDEVRTSCWNKSHQIQAWLKQHNFTMDDAYMYFVKRAHTIAQGVKKTPVNWEEVFNHFGSNLDKETVIHVWLSHATAAKVVAAGYRCILSNSNVWYLPHLGTTWEKMYENDPYMNIDDPDEQKLILGGEACMWGETGDSSDLEWTIWPRAAAVAERLWSHSDVNNTVLMLPRLQSFRCLLTRRSIAAAPVLNNQAREAPPGPGSCYGQ